MATRFRTLEESAYDGRVGRSASGNEVRSLSPRAKICCRATLHPAAERELEKRLATESLVSKI